MLANWQNVFRAINLATGNISCLEERMLMVVKLSNLGSGDAEEEEEERALPEMLVRIPVTTDSPSDDQDKSS